MLDVTLGEQQTETWIGELTASEVPPLDGFGLTVVEQLPIEISPNAENRRYLEAKRDKLGHRLHHQDLRNPDWEIE